MPRLKGEAYEIRFADDAILCFQHKEDPEEVLGVLPKRFEKYGLTLHPEKTRLIEFGRHAAKNARKLGQKPATFNFLGFTHICVRSRQRKFTVQCCLHHSPTAFSPLQNRLAIVFTWVEGRDGKTATPLHYHRGHPVWGQPLRSFLPCAAV
jgi:hypothetical protein